MSFLSSATKWLEVNQQRWFPVACIAAAASASIYVIRKWAAGGKCTTIGNLSGKTILITGANIGIGKATAEALAQRNTIIMACRDQTRGEQAAADIKKTVPQAKLEVLPLDLSSLASVRAFVKNLSLRGQKIDVLVNNAGVMMIPKRELTEDGFEMQVGTNHLGHFLLTNLILREKILEKGRIVTVASRAHERFGKARLTMENLLSENDYNPMLAYAKSKLSNVLFTRELQRRLKEQGNNDIHAFSLHPGVVRSELWRHLPGASILTKVPPFPWIAWLILKSPFEGAQTSLHCITAPGIEKHGGEYFADCDATPTSKDGNDMDLAKKLWDKSAELVRL